MPNYLDLLPKTFFALAPMDDVTDTVFRQIISSCAKPDLFFTEFVNVDGLQSAGRKKLINKLQFTPTEQPLIAQIWGKTPDNFFKTAEQIANGKLAKELGLAKEINFAGVDLNMGCPQKNEVISGTCSALINNRPLAKEIIEATKEGLDKKLPLSIKTRTGFNEVDMSWLEFILKQNINMLTIHGRTKKDKSKVPANWGVIGEARQLRDRIAPATLVVGNGDVLTREQGLKLAKEYKLDGIMIGRGVFNDPYVFAENSPWSTLTPTQKIELYKKQVNLFTKTWPNTKPIKTLNKFCKIYINGFNNAQEVRNKLMKATTTKELIDLLNHL
jgi:tRNA-dihydrouridine synthase